VRAQSLVRVLLRSQQQGQQRQMVRLLTTQLLLPLHQHSCQRQHHMRAVSRAQTPAAVHMPNGTAHASLRTLSGCRRTALLKQPTKRVAGT
jgi:hypothetical protein